jgi:hypothetical protein
MAALPWFRSPATWTAVQRGPQPQGAPSPHLPLRFVTHTLPDRSTAMPPVVDAAPEAANPVLGETAAPAFDSALTVPLAFANERHAMWVPRSRLARRQEMVAMVG